MRTRALDTFDSSVAYDATAWSWSGASNPPQPIQSEGAFNNYLGYGTFGKKGSGGVALLSDTGALVDGVNYRTNDYLDGSPSVYNIYDPNGNVAFSSGKYFRLIASGTNVKTAYGLRPVAKTLSLPYNQLVSPPANQFYIDVQNGKFLMPRPIFWSRVESASSWQYPDIQYGALPPDPVWGYTWSAGQMVVDYQPGKFGYCLRHVSSAQNWLGGGGVVILKPFNLWGYTIPNGTLSACGGSVVILKPFNLWGYTIPNGTLSAWVYCSAGAWSSSNIQVVFNSSTYLQLTQWVSGFFYQYEVRWSINGAAESAVAIDPAYFSSWRHLVITWSGSEKTTNIKFYLDGTLLANINHAGFDVNEFRIQSAQNHAWIHTAGTNYIDNVKIWNHVLSNPQIGTTYETALHPCYGAPYYSPGAMSVGYYTRGVLSDSAWQLRPPTTDAQVQLEAARDFLFAEGYIGFKENLKDNNGAGYENLEASVHYQYEKRLDASATEDPNYGFDRTDEVTSGGIYDTAASGALGLVPNTKFFRIVENGKNVRFTGTGGLGLAIMAKDLTNSDICPPPDQCYVDPARGKFILPRPNYFCKCESIAELANPTLRDIETPFVTGISASNFALTDGKTEFGGYGITTEQSFTNVGYVYPFGYSTSISYVSQTGTDSTHIVFSSTQTFLPGEIVTVMVGNTTAVRGITSFTVGGTDTTFVVELLDELAPGDVIIVGNKMTKGTMSFWINIDQATNSTAAFIVYLGGVNSYIYIDQDYLDIYINSFSVVSRHALGIDMSSTYHHVYLMWDQTGSLQANTKRIRLWIDNTEITWTETIPVWAAGDFAFKFHVINNAVTIDNIKIWKHLVRENPDWEWGTAGAGNEDAMHSMYGSDNNYVPDCTSGDSGVGYYKKAGLTDVAIWTV